MDTLPLSDNFNNSYVLREDDYEDPALSCPTACALRLDDAALEKMIISELVHNNLRPRRLPPNQTDSKCQPGSDSRRDRDLSAQESCDGGVGNRVDVIVGDADADTSALSPSASHQPLELLLLHPSDREPLEAPLLPQRTHSLLYCAQKESHQKASREPEEDEQSVQEEANVPSPNNRDSLYTSMPNLRDSQSPSPSESPDLVSGQEGGSPRSSAQSELEEHCYKSLPDLGDGTPALSYYQISRGGASEGCIGSSEATSDGQMQLITSL